MSKEQPGKKALTTLLPIELVDAVNTKAEELERTPAGIVREALMDWLAWEEEKHRRILEELADVDAGNTISDEEMDAWLDSLGTDHEIPAPK